MKRQKRDKMTRAHHKGYKENCPFQQNDAKSQWLGGWREAMEDRQTGFAVK